jgi:hypothetical protein
MVHRAHGVRSNSEAPQSPFTPQVQVGLGNLVHNQNQDSDDPDPGWAASLPFPSPSRCRSIVIYRYVRRRRLRARPTWAAVWKHGHHRQSPLVPLHGEIVCPIRHRAPRKVRGISRQGWLCPVTLDRALLLGGARTGAYYPTPSAPRPYQLM